MRTGAAIAIAVSSSLITGAVSGWQSSENTVSALQIEIQWIKKTIETNSDRISMLERWVNRGTERY